MGRYGVWGRRAGNGGDGVAHTSRNDGAFDHGEPVVDLADRLLEIADGGLDAPQAVVHRVRDANGDRAA